MNQTKLGQVQLRIVQLLWERKRATAREITEELSRETNIAHSTVQTLLRQLEGKGTVGHELEGRTFYFYPIVQEENVTVNATKNFIQSIFRGSVKGLVAHLLEHEKISAQELAEIRDLIEHKKVATKGKSHSKRVSIKKSK